MALLVLRTNIIWRVYMLKSNTTSRQWVVQRQKFIKILSRRFHVNVLSVKYTEKKNVFWLTETEITFKTKTRIALYSNRVIVGLD